MAPSRWAIRWVPGRIRVHKVMPFWARFDRMGDGMAVGTRMKVVRIPDEDLAASFAVRWGVRPSQLERPVPRPSDIPRTALIDRIRASSARLTTICAPPGYGKTTLAAQYVDLDDRRSAWLSITEDSDKTALARMLALASSAVLPIDATLLEELTAARPRRSLITAGLCASVAQAPDPFLLVVDDVHVLSDPATIALLAAVAGEVPPGSEIVLVSRNLAAFSLAGTRVHEDLFELDAEDLRLEVGDADLLLRRAGATDLGSDEVAALTEQTEGWAVGLYLAALSRRSGSAIDGAPAFGGDDRFVTDYVRENILARLPEDEVGFLVRTSVLEELSGPLCDAILEVTGSGARLEALEGANLLVVPLDHRRERFRYHHLLRDLLRAELEHRSPELVPALYARASAWCEEQGAYDLAIGYARAGHLPERVAHLFERYGQRAYFSGRAADVLAWMSWLDEHGSMEDHPYVAALGGWLMALEGRVFDARRFAETADRSKASRTDEAEGCIALLRAAMCRDGVTSAVGDVRRAATLLPSKSPSIPNQRLWRGLLEVVRGDRESAERSFRSCVELGTELGTAPATSVALAELAILAWAGGDLEHVASRVKEARSVIDEAGLSGYPSSALTYAMAARVALNQGDPGRARGYARGAAGLRGTWTIALPILSLHLRIQLAWSALALAELKDAETYLREIDEIVDECGDLGSLAAEIEAARTQAELLQTSRRGIQALSPAEARLMPLLTTHLSFREIGEELHLSPHTVKTQAISIYRKLGVTSRASAVDMAREIGLLV